MNDLNYILKSKIIVHILNYFDDNDALEKKLAIENLEIFARFYNFKLRRQISNPDVKQHLRDFILNYTGYISTIQNLYNSLYNEKEN